MIIIKRILTVLACSGLLAISTTAVVFAHQTETSGNISAELHIEPYDNPTAGQKSRIVVVFEDAPKGFDLHRCTCAITILRGSSQVASAPLTLTSNTTSTNSYTFKQAGNYTLHISGTAAGNADFADFSLNFTTTVSKATDSTSTSGTISPAMWILVAIGIVVIITTGIVMERGKKYSQTEEKLTK